MCDFKSWAARMFRAAAILTLALGVAGPPRPAAAITLDDMTMQGWYGSGPNRAALVVDFSAGNGTADSFAFGVNFDTPISGYDLLNLVQTGTGNAFHFTSTYWGAALGHSIDEMWYTDPHTSIEYHADGTFTGAWPATWWSYWTSADAGQTWSDPGIGADSRTISADGAVDGWLAKYGDDYTSEPIAPVPEPATSVLWAMAALAAMGYGARAVSRRAKHR